MAASHSVKLGFTFWRDSINNSCVRQRQLIRRVNGLLDRGFTPRAIRAKIPGVSNGMISHYASVRGLHFRRGKPAKPTTERIKQIVRACLAERQAHVAIRFGVTRQRVNGLVASWRRGEIIL